MQIAWDMQELYLLKWWGHAKSTTPMPRSGLIKSAYAKIVGSHHLFPFTEGDSGDLSWFLLQPSPLTFNSLGRHTILTLKEEENRRAESGRNGKRPRCDRRTLFSSKWCIEMADTRLPNYVINMKENANPHMKYINPRYNHYVSENGCDNILCIDFR